MYLGSWFQRVQSCLVGRVWYSTIAYIMATEKQMGGIQEEARTRCGL